MNDSRHTGLFISLEGGEGSGKSTQIKRLQTWLAQKLPSREIITTREPGGTPTAEAIRRLLVTGSVDSLTAKTEALLMLASRVEHVERLIMPALEKGAIILSDRFADSSFVYQTITGGYDEAQLRHLHEVSIGSITPHKTYLMDLSPEEGLARAGERTSQEEARFESKGLSYHQQVRDGYLRIANQEPARFDIIDATQTPDEIFDTLQSSLATLLDEHGISQ